jgi:hypothetical protein
MHAYIRARFFFANNMCMNIVLFMNEFMDAAENYTKSMEVDYQKFVFSHMQLAMDGGAVQVGKSGEQHDDV